MADEKRDEEERGFVIKDKRFGAKKEGGEDSSGDEKRKIPAEEKGPAKEESSKEEEKGTLPEINFLNFIFSLSTSVLIQLGEMKDPNLPDEPKNLPVAKQTIDIIGMLKEKTKGNLTPEEDKLIDHVLYDLRMRYVKQSS